MQMQIMCLCFSKSAILTKSMVKNYHKAQKIVRKKVLVSVGRKIEFLYGSSFLSNGEPFGNSLFLPISGVENTNKVVASSIFFSYLKNAQCA